MKKLTQIAEKTSVFVLDIEGDKNERRRLHSLGVLPEKIISVIKNPKGNAPLIIEIDEARFALSRDLANDIFVTHVLDGQDLIFDAHHTNSSYARCKKALILDKR
jgi:Fe2+ transport system protein FeoA